MTPFPSFGPAPPTVWLRRPSSPVAIIVPSLPSDAPEELGAKSASAGMDVSGNERRGELCFAPTISS